ncbi:MAG: hypothetical protein WBH20_14835 [Oceanisphaera sp.]|uniref:hypothetical protein n=1 Tax=Oceanisphaera sp. TaxID=1929979 RepID=UPI003C76F8D8
MNQVTNLRPAGSLSTESQATHALVLFMTGELLPDMIMNWPNGASRVEQNLQGAAQSYARQLAGKGFTPALIREALQIEIESERDFMPKPIELANRCKALMGGSAKPTVKPVISTAAVKLMANSRLWAANLPTTAEAVDREAAKLAQSYQAQGVQVQGGDW